MTQPRHLDVNAPVEDRVDHLLGQMTLQEKSAQLTSVWLAFDPDTGQMAPFQQEDVRRGVDPAAVLANGIGHITRPFGSRPIEPAVGVEWLNSLQRRLVDGTRLGIPAICHEECLTGLMAQGATSFPSPLNLAATWDPGLAEDMAAVIRRQMRSIGTHQGLAPVADVARDARWGRVEETLGEDPYLVGLFVSAYVRGLQGTDLREGVVATLKHFAGYSFSEGGRNFAPVHVGRREMADVFLIPFEMAVKDAGALGVMAAYVAIDGEPAHASRWLLTEVLRDQWGFDGAVVADYGGVSLLRDQHRVAPTRAAAVASALGAGMDLELPGPAEMLEGVTEALDLGLVDMATVDEAVRRVLRLKVRLGLFEKPYADGGSIALHSPADETLAARIAAKSITLLTNDGTLPLPVDAGRVLVVGPNADDRMALFGNYSFENHVVSTHFPDQADEIVTSPTVLEMLRQRMGGTMDFERGAQVMDDDTSAVPAAAAAASAADLVIAVVGDRAGHFRAGTVGEGTDTTDLGLPGGQAQLLEAVLQTGTPTVVVLLNGRPFSLGSVAERAAAIVEAWFPGLAGAEAIVDVLLGTANPAGRTPLTFSQGAGVQPRSYNHTTAARGVPILPEFSATFAFGHGLSYTSFDYADLEAPPRVAVDGVLELTCTVRNTGDRAGDEVVQVYVRDLGASVTRPVQQLVAFRRVSLDPGESARIRFEVPVDLLSYTGPSFQRMLEPGPIEVMVGASSADIRLRAPSELDGATRLLGHDRRLSGRSELA